MIRKLLLLNMILLVSAHAFSQDTLLLKKQLDQATDTEKVDLYNKLAWEYRKIKPEQAIKYLYKALDLAQDLGYNYGKCVAYNYLGIEFRNLGYYSASPFFYDQALALANKYGFVEQAAYSYINLGNLYYRIGLYNKALKYLDSADSVSRLLLKAKNANAYRVLAYIYNNYARVYLAQDKLDKAISYYKQALDLWKSTDYKKIGVIFREMAQAYIKKGDLALARKLLDSIPGVYDLKNDLQFAGVYYLVYSQYYFRSGQLDSSLFMFTRAEQVAKKYNSLVILMTIYENWTRLYKALGDYKKANQMLTKAYELKNKIFSKELESSIQAFEYTNSQERKIAQIRELKKQVTIDRLRARLQRNLLLMVSMVTGLFVISFVIVLILHLRLRDKQILIEQQNDELKTQRDELEAQQAELLQQKMKIQAHDQMLQENIKYAATIQMAMLPSTRLIQQYFDSFIIYLPRDIISGDFYWFWDKHPRYLFFVLGDCTGHGVSGAILSVIVMHIFKTVIVENNVLQPGLIMVKVNRMLDEMLRRKELDRIDGFDGTLVRFDRQDFSKVIISLSGSSLLVYYPRKKEIKRFRSGKFSANDAEYAHDINSGKFEQEVEIEDQSIIYLYSDGFIDQNGIDLKRYGTPRFIKFIKSIADQDMDVQKILLMKELSRFMQGHRQRDDITIVALRPRK